MKIIMMFLLSVSCMASFTYEGELFSFFDEELGSCSVELDSEITLDKLVSVKSFQYLSQTVYDLDFEYFTNNAKNGQLYFDTSRDGHILNTSYEGRLLELSYQDVNAEIYRCRFYGKK